MMSYNGGRWRLLSLIISTIRSFCLRITLFLFGDILTLPEHLLQWMTESRARPRVAGRQVKQWLFSHITYLPNLIILCWIYTLVRGEYGIFDDSINSCDWATWEKWPAGAAPHHLVYVADPQLVDPHTYPGRPWPLSALTIQQTDLYMRRAYSRIQRKLDPSTIFFLGDLFDGGREWSTATSESPEEQYREYGSLFWQEELDRFSRIFLKEWGRQEGVERRIIASLPGNHDLGFGKGIQKAVRDRFQAFFGDGNRIDIIGNHTFVSLDSVSFSAKEDAESTLLKDIWQPAETFLDSVKIEREEMVKAALGVKQDLSKESQHRHVIEDIIYSEIKIDGAEQQGPEKNRIQGALQQSKRDLVLVGARNSEKLARRALKIPPPDFPTVLLTHVPLFRAPGTPCGPLRERHPPSLPPLGQTEPVKPDFPNSIDSPGHGYQYQNVMSETLTKEILNHVVSGGSSDLKYVFSGDDHDYCELVHHVPFSAGVKEITVKSISFAMGVRRPGFVLASLWNPVDKDGQRLAGADTQTMQTHLCLLPDQLGTFIHYGVLIGLSVVVLTLRAIAAALLVNRTKSATDTQSELANVLTPTLHTFSTPSRLASHSNSTLPTTGRLRSYSSAEREKRAFLDDSAYPESINRGRLTSSLSSSKSHASPARSRNGGTAPIPLVLPSYVYSAGDAEAGLQDLSDPGKSAGDGHGILWTLLVEWTWSLWYVARVAILWYAWLLGS